jgi:bifunctional DNA-binding transcriptional regulator/antitoxin component of YhaV-PrlF toxin-antitoxin module
MSEIPTKGASMATKSVMAEHTVRLGDKGQFTIPKKLQRALALKKGDIFGIVVHTPSDIRLVPYAHVRKDLITPQVEKILQQRRKEIEDGGELVSLEEVLKKAAAKNKKAASNRELATA